MAAPRHCSMAAPRHCSTPRGTGDLFREGRERERESKQRCGTWRSGTARGGAAAARGIGGSAPPHHLRWRSLTSVGRRRSTPTADGWSR
eukprot:4308384-Prymnesium_polylepis.1